jgi:hypothetical protein
MLGTVDLQEYCNSESFLKGFDEALQMLQSTLEEPYSGISSGAEDYCNEDHSILVSWEMSKGEI